MVSFALEAAPLGGLSSNVQSFSFAGVGSMENPFFADKTKNKFYIRFVSHYN